METDVEDDYGDEWGAEQAEDAGDEGLESGNEAVHPLALAGKLEGHAEATTTIDYSQGLKHPLDASYQKEDGWKARATIITVTSSVTEGEDDAAVRDDQSGLEEGELPMEPTTAKHTQHYKRTRLTPPPPPCPAQGSLVMSEANKTDTAALYARVAAIRITKYREMAHEREQETRREQAELAQRRKDVRQSSKPIYEAYGVANLTPADRLRLTVRALKKQAKLSEHAADLERKNRWYNKQATRRSAAAAHTQQLSSKEMRVRRKQERLTRDAMVHLRSNQEHLKQEARTRIARNTCEYVRGSYLLKVSPANARVRVRPKTDSSRVATNADMTDE